jgi:hypothetical protein
MPVDGARVLDDRTLLKAATPKREAHLVVCILASTIATTDMVTRYDAQVRIYQIYQLE